MSVLPRIQYNSINVDFDRGVNVWNLTRDQRRVENESASGIIETLSYFERERVAIQRRISSADLQAQLEQFWLYARTGQTFSFWRDRDLSAYWDFEGKSHTNNDSVAGTFTRATTAYYTDPTDGLVKSVASGTARFPAGKFGRGILLETAATNIVLRSEEFDNASWTASSITVGANTTATKDPNGGTTAELLTLTAATGSLQQDVATSISTNNGVFSVYLRTHETGSQSGTLYIKRADTDATLASSAITVTNTWTRFYVGYASGGSVAANWRVKIELTGDTKIFAVWGGMLEVGTAILTPTSYIQTTSASVTRNADVLSFTASSFLDDEPRYGSISFWYAVNVADSNQNRAFVLVDALGSGNIIDISQTAGELVVFTIKRKVGADISVTSGSQAGSDVNFHHYVFTWDTTISNGFKIYHDGALIGTSSNSAFPISRIGTNFYIGTSSGNTNANGVIDDFEIRKDVLTAGQIANYYNSGRARGWRRNYYSSMLIDQDSYEPGLVEGGWRFDIPLVLKEVLT